MFPAISTNRFLLRQFVPEDIEKVYLGLSHPEVIKYYGVSFSSLEATQEQMDWFKNIENEKSGIWWAICSKDNKTFYGAAGLNDVEKVHRKAESGFWLLPEFWGKGIMKEVMPVVCNFGFQNLNLHRIEAFVDAENNNCKKALAKLDFKHEGTMKDCEIKNGSFLSVDIYAMINPDYTSIVVAKRENLDDVLKLQKVAYKQEAEIYNDFTIQPLLQDLDAVILEWQNGTILLAINNGQIVGSVRGMNYNGRCKIGKLIVKPNFQNRGIGKLLLREIEKSFENCSAYELFTGHRSEKNLSLYQRSGYLVFKEETINENLIIKHLQKIQC